MILHFKPLYTQRKFFNYQLFTSTKQILESYWEAEQKVQELAYMLKNSKHTIAFTGAGISTSIGIPDYRSGHDTIIKTGPGLWNRSNTQQSKKDLKPIDKLVDEAIPSITHMSIVTLIKHNYIKHLVSQNTDGLHLKSGVPLSRISQLHGNRNQQYCIQCGIKYLRDFRTIKRDDKKYQPGQKRQHLTDRKCQNCEGNLHDSIIYFGQKLPKQELSRAFYHAKLADLCICIGSSLTVRPSSNVPLMVVQKQNKGKLAIINIQQTPFDNRAQLKINYFCDDVMQLLLKKLNLNLQKQKIQHLLIMKFIEDSLIISGKDLQQRNLSFIKQAYLVKDNNKQQLKINGHKCCIDVSALYKFDKIIIILYGNKPDIMIPMDQIFRENKKQLKLKYKLQNGQWQYNIN